jgi:DNA mismatch endonuclease (patch repair protein)
MVFRKARIAVFVDGCFWHGCPEHCRLPTANREYWTAKINRNRSRDLATTVELTALGWTVLRFWAHDDPDAAAKTIRRQVERARFENRA